MFFCCCCSCCSLFYFRNPHTCLIRVLSSSTSSQQCTSFLLSIVLSKLLLMFVSFLIVLILTNTSCLFVCLFFLGMTFNSIQGLHSLITPNGVWETIFKCQVFNLGHHLQGKCPTAPDLLLLIKLKGNIHMQQSFYFCVLTQENYICTLNYKIHTNVHTNFSGIVTN